MSASPAGAPPGESTFIRAGGGVQLSPRRAGDILLGVLVALLAGLAVYFAVTGAQQNSELSALRQRGVPVEASVTGCRGISSGVGMGIEYWECRGSYTLGGQSFNAVINGSRKLLDQGTQVSAIAVPGRPDLLSSNASVRGVHGSGTEYAAAISLGAAALLVGGGWLVFRRRRQAAAG